MSLNTAAISFKVGFTGTQRGMTEKQKEKVKYLLLSSNRKIEAHHGDCIGADSEFHDIAKSLGAHIVIHPPSNSSKRAFKKGDIERKPKDYLSRNKDIVNETIAMIATPGEYKEVLRSGTWSTIRYKRKKDKNIFIVYPDGTVGL